MIEFTQDEIAFGQLLDARITEAQIRLEERNRMRAEFIQYLGNKYNLSGEVQFIDWANGFTVGGASDGKLHNQ